MLFVTFKSLKLQFFPLCVGDVGVTVSPSNPLFYNESDYITPDQLQDSTPIFHAYFDAGPYSDILSRLKIPAASDRFIVTSRAAMYELLAQTNSYYINSIFFKTGEKMRRMLASFPQRSLILSGNDIKSEFGWFKREKMTLNTMTMDLINMISEYFSDNFYE